MKGKIMAQKTVSKIISPHERHWVGDGFYVSTLFSMHSEAPELISPFLLLDHGSPKEFTPSESKRGVGTHPHRGFETVTFAIQGEVEHRDSGGGGGTITTGGVQWMTAGSGVVHEEFHSKNFSKKGGTFEMVQLWINLPKEHKMTKPRYQSMDQEDFPLVKIDKGTVKVVAGSFQGSEGPAQTFSPINIYEVRSAGEQKLELSLPVGSNTLIVQLQGSLKIQNQEVTPGKVALMSQEGEAFTLNLSSDAHFLVLNGEPLKDPVVAYGPFVMTSKAEILTAIKDFEEGKMGQLVEENNQGGL